MGLGYGFRRFCPGALSCQGLGLRFRAWAWGLGFKAQGLGCGA